MLGEMHDKRQLCEVSLLGVEENLTPAHVGTGRLEQIVLLAFGLITKKKITLNNPFNAI